MSNYNRNYNYNKNRKKKGDDNALIPILILCAIFIPGFLAAAIPLFVVYKVLKEFGGIDLVEQVKSFIGENFGETSRKSNDPCENEEYHQTFSEKQGKREYTVRPRTPKDDPCGDEQFHSTFQEGSRVTYNTPSGKTSSRVVRGTYTEKKVTKTFTSGKKDDPCGNEGYHNTFAEGQHGSSRRFSSRFTKNIGDGKILTLVGGILAGVFGFATIMEIIDIFPYMSLLNEDVFVPALFALVSGVAALKGRSRTKRAAQFRKLRTLLGEDTNRISIRALADAMPCTEAKADKLLQAMIDEGLLTPNAYIDGATGYLILDGQGVEQDADHTAEPARRDVEEELNILAEIRRVNDSIPDPVLTRKISRIEEITGQILDYQKKHPEKSSELRKFLNYYLPTTLRILNTYAELEEKGISGENINTTKARIEGMMDKVVEGFETQLDQLFAGDMMDISSDIAVMEKMMNNDGLTSELRIPKVQEPSAADNAFEQINLTLNPESKPTPAVSAIPVMDMPTPPVAPPVPHVSAPSAADDMFRSINLTLDPEKKDASASAPSFGGGADGMFASLNQGFAVQEEEASEADAMFQSLHKSEGDADWQSGFYRHKKEDL